MFFVLLLGHWQDTGGLGRVVLMVGVVIVRVSLFVVCCKCQRSRLVGSGAENALVQAIRRVA